MFDLQAWIYRFANVVGGCQTHGVGFDFIKKLREDNMLLEILGDGNQSKSYIHVGYVVDAMLYVIEKVDDSVGGVIQVMLKGCGLNRANWTYEELAVQLYRTTGIALKRTAMRDFCQRQQIRPYRPTYRYLRGDPTAKRRPRGSLPS